MTREEVLDWLGDTEATDNQIEALQRLARDLEAVYPSTDPDTAECGRDAFTQGAMVILGDTTTDQVVAEWKALQADLHAATVRMRGALSVELQNTPESTVASKYGLARNTVRKANGK